MHDFNATKILYEVPDSDVLESIEITSDLYTINFNLNRTEDFEKRQSNSDSVLSTLESSLPKRFSLSHSIDDITLCGLNDSHEAMSDTPHDIEVALNGVKESGLIGQDLYLKIRADVRHRVQQLRNNDKAQKACYENLRSDISESVTVNTTFKNIKKANDAKAFKGAIVAYKAATYFFKGSGQILHPSDGSIQFARVTSFGQLRPYIIPSAMQHEFPLTDAWIQKDVGLAMRFATLEELQFLHATSKLEQGIFSISDTAFDVELLEQKITERGGCSLMSISYPEKPAFTACPEKTVSQVDNIHAFHAHSSDDNPNAKKDEQDSTMTTSFTS